MAAKTDQLLADIFDSQYGPFSTEFEGWLRQSRRFRAFATHYRTKIRAKLRQANNWKDVRAELETALLLLGERRFELEYEKYAALKERGPDFTVTFKTHTLFNVEVRRLKGEGDATAESGSGKLVAVIGEKVRQMPPSVINLLWLACEGGADEEDVAQAALTLRQLAEAKEEAFFQRQRYPNARAFLKQYQQLSGIVLRQHNRQTVWLNPLARHAAPPEIVRAVEGLEIG
jgi:hypothetical protein